MHTYVCMCVCIRTFIFTVELPMQQIRTCGMQCEHYQGFFAPYYPVGGSIAVYGVMPNTHNFVHT